MLLQDKLNLDPNFVFDKATMQFNQVDTKNQAELALAEEYNCASSEEHQQVKNPNDLPQQNEISSQKVKAFENNLDATELPPLPNDWPLFPKTIKNKNIPDEDILKMIVNQDQRDVDTIKFV